MPRTTVNPQCQPNQKNRSTIEQIALPNLKRSGFVFEFADA